MRSAAGRPLQSRSEMHHGFAAAIATVTKCLNQVCNLFLMCLIVCVNPMMCSSIHSACCRPAPWSFEWFFLHVFMCFLTWTVHLSLHSGQLVRWLSALLFSLFKSKKPALVRCRFVGGRRCRLCRHTGNRQRRSHDKGGPIHLLCKAMYDMCKCVNCCYAWFPTRRTHNRIVHSLNGNISMKDLTDVMQKLGMTQAWMKESAKAVLQDSNKKQRAQEYLQKGLLFEVGRLIHDTPVSPSSGGKGAGKGKSKQKQIGQTARTPWSNLTPRPDLNLR